MEELIENSKNGDKKSFTELILQMQIDLYRIAKIRLKDDNDISDAIQETMIRAYKNINKPKDNSKFKNWIIGILINECKRIYNKKSHKKKLLEKIIIKENVESSDFSIQNTNSKIDFELLIQDLDYSEKVIITLYYNNKYSCNEIAEILNMNVNTVKSKLTRAKEKIKKNCKGGVIYEQ